MLGAKNTLKILKKELIISICICVILSSVFSEFYIINEYHHECLGYGCKTCQQIEIYNECNHNSIGGEPFLGLTFTLVYWMYVGIFRNIHQLDSRTLITLKVELLC